MLFFYPLDWTFVCPTEIIAFSDRIQEFRDIGVEVGLPACLPWLAAWLAGWLAGWLGWLAGWLGCLPWGWWVHGEWEGQRGRATREGGGRRLLHLHPRSDCTRASPGLAQVVGASVDSVFSHLAWIQTPRNKGGLGGLGYPLLAGGHDAVVAPRWQPACCSRRTLSWRPASMRAASGCPALACCRAPSSRLLTRALHALHGRSAADLTKSISKVKAAAVGWPRGWFHHPRPCPASCFLAPGPRHAPFADPSHALLPASPLPSALPPPSHPQDYEVLIEEGENAGVALRGLFIIGPDGRLRQKTVNDLPVGRSGECGGRMCVAWRWSWRAGLWGVWHCGPGLVPAENSR